MMKGYFPRLTNQETSHAFRGFDRGHKGHISKQDFLTVLSSDVREQQPSTGLQISIEDIIKPLVTRIRKRNVNVNALFDKYDRNRNSRLAPEEIANALLAEY